jgi:hypothetical protein
MKIQAFRNKGGGVMEYPLAGGAAYIEGAAVVLTGGNAVECGADPAKILGFAAHDAGAMPNTTKILVEVARPGGTFFMAGSRAPLETDKGVAYGIAKDGDGVWHVDATDTVNTRVMVEDVDLVRGLWEVSVLDANRQLS